MRLVAIATALLFTAGGTLPAWGQDGVPAAPSPRPDAQTLARHVFAVLTGEIAAHTGHPGVAYIELLKSARDIGDATLFRRAAEVALHAGQPDKALAAALAWRHAQPDSQEARAWVVQLQLLTGQNKQAAESIAQDLARTPEPQRGQAIAVLIPMALRANDPASTLALMQKALAAQHQFAQTHVVIGLLRMRLGDNKGAFADARHALRIMPGLPQAAALMLQSYAVNPAEADAALHAYMAAEPKDAGMRLAWAQSALEAQRDGVAYVQLQQVVADMPDKAVAWLLLGNLQTEFGEPARAIESLQTYVRLARAEADAKALTPAYLALAEASRKLGDLGQATRWLDQIKPDAANRVALVSARAAVLVRQGEFNAAMDLASALPSATDDEAKNRLFTRAQVLRDAKLYVPAFQVLESGVRRFPNDTDMLYEAAMMADKAGHYPTMERWLRKAIKLDPGFQAAYNALGYTMVVRGESLPQARKLIEHALALSPGNPFVLDSLGWLDFKEGRGKDAAKALREAYDARPDPEIGAHLGEVLWSLGDHGGARKVWQEAFKRAPENTLLLGVLHKYGVAF